MDAIQQDETYLRVYVYVYDNISKDNKFPKSPNPHSQRGFGNGVESVRTVLYLNNLDVELETERSGWPC